MLSFFRPLYFSVMLNIHSFFCADPIMAVGPEETAATLWGADKSDPKEALVENSFKMKNIVLTRPPGNPGGRRRPRTNNRKA